MDITQSKQLARDISNADSAAANSA